MSLPDPPPFWVFMSIALALIIGSTIGSIGERRKLRTTAVAAGVAYYSVDPATGKTQFKFITEP